MAGKKPTLRPQDRRALMAGAIAVLVLLGYSRVGRPAFQRFQLDRQTVADQEALLARERSLLAAAPAFPRMRNDAGHQLAEEAPRLFVGDSVAATAELTAYVAEMATASGVHLTAVDGRAPRTERGVTRLSVDIRGDGSWRQVLTFIRALESSSRLIDATNVRVERGPRAGPLGGPLVSLSATLVGFSRVDK